MVSVISFILSISGFYFEDVIYPVLAHGFESHSQLYIYCYIVHFQQNTVYTHSSQQCSKLICSHTPSNGNHGQPVHGLPMANKFAPVANNLATTPNEFTSMVHYFTPAATNLELNMSLAIHRGIYISMYISHFSPHGHSKFLNAIHPHNNPILIIIVYLDLVSNKEDVK